MFTFKKAFLLLRPHNIAAAVLSVATGYAIAGGGTPWPVWLILATATATAAGNVINDWFDSDIDSINKPGRPLPSGGVTPGAAMALYLFLLALLAFFMTRLPLIEAAWVLAWALLLHAYSWKAKRSYLAGNLLVSSVVSSAFLLGAYAAGDASRGAIPTAYSFFFVLGRELVKDTEDIEGDRECGAATVPVVSGPGAALKTASLIFIMLLLAAPLPFATGAFGAGYMIVMALSVMPVLVVSSVCCAMRRAPGRISLLLKIGMFFGTAAFYLGGRR